MLSDPFATIRLDPSWTLEFTRDEAAKLCGAKRGNAAFVLYALEAALAEDWLKDRRRVGEAVRAAGLHHDVGDARDEIVGGRPAFCGRETRELYRVAGCPLLEVGHTALVDLGDFVLGITIDGKYRTTKPAEDTALDEIEALYMEIFPFDPTEGASVAQAFRGLLDGVSFDPAAIEGITVEALDQQAQDGVYAVRAVIPPGFVLPGLCRVGSSPSCDEEAWEWRVKLARKPFPGKIEIHTDHVERDTRSADLQAFKAYLTDRSTLLRRLNEDWTPILDGVVEHFLPFAEADRDPDEVPDSYTPESLRRALTRASVFLSTPDRHDPSALSITFFDANHDVLGGHGLGAFFDAEGKFLRFEQN